MGRKSLLHIYIYICIFTGGLCSTKSLAGFPSALCLSPNMTVNQKISQISWFLFPYHLEMANPNMTINQKISQISWFLFPYHLEMANPNMTVNQKISQISWFLFPYHLEMANPNMTVNQKISQISWFLFPYHLEMANSPNCGTLKIKNPNALWSIWGITQQLILSLDRGINIDQPAISRYLGRQSKCCLQTAKTEKNYIVFVGGHQTNTSQIMHRVHVTMPFFHFLKSKGPKIFQQFADDNGFPIYCCGSLGSQNSGFYLYVSGVFGFPKQMVKVWAGVIYVWLETNLAMNQNT